jgi:hypothetical protein
MLNNLQVKKNDCRNESSGPNNQEKSKIFIRSLIFLLI